MVRQALIIVVVFACIYIRVTLVKSLYQQMDSRLGT